MADDKNNKDDDKISRVDPDEAYGSKQPPSPFSEEDRGGDISSESPREQQESFAENVRTEPEAPGEGEGREEEEDEEVGFWEAFTHDKKLLYSTLGIILFIIVVAGALFYFLFGRTEAPPAPDVSLDIAAPSRVTPNREFDMDVRYVNRSDKVLEDVELSILYPSGFTFKQSMPSFESDNGRVFSLPDLSAGETGKVSIKGLMDGQAGDTRSIKVTLDYKVSGVSASYKTENSIDLVMGSPDLTLSVNGPANTTTGQEVVYNITYRNISEDVLRDVRLELKTPSEFEITETDPEIGEDDVWDLGDIAPGEEEGFKVLGVYNQEVGVQRVVEVLAIEGEDNSEISRAFTVTEVDKSPLVINQSISSSGDDVVLPGERLSYTIDIENNGDSTLTNLVVSTELEGNAYDLSSLETDGGILTGNTITWTPGGVNALRTLAAGDSATIEYKINIKNPPTSAGDKSMTVSSTPQVTSFELKEPIVGSSIDLKVKTQTDLVQSVEYESGQWPMEVGEETRLKVTWDLTNTTNTITGVRIAADLPLGASSFVRGHASSGTSISFDESRYVVAWNLDKVEPHSQETAFFIVSVTPSSSDRNDRPTLASNITLEGTDSFVEQPVYDETPVGDAEAPGRVE